MPANNEWLDAASYMEVMTGEIVKLYNNPDKFFDIAKKAYIQSCAYWTESQQEQALLNLFRDAYKSYDYYERQKLPERFLDFATGLPVPQSSINRIYRGFYQLISRKEGASSFLLLVTKYPVFQDVYNAEIAEEMTKARHDYVYLETFRKNFHKIVDYLYTETLKRIATTAIDPYYDYSPNVLVLINRNKPELANLFLHNKSLGFYDEGLRDIIKRAEHKGYLEVSKYASHILLATSEISFTDFYNYYKLLTPEEREDESTFLSNVAYQNKLTRLYSFLGSKNHTESSLKSLNLESFLLFHDVIVKEFKEEVYAPLLINALVKQFEKTGDTDLILSSIETYQDSDRFLTDPRVQDLTYYLNEIRAAYLKILYKKDKLEQSGSYIYEG